MRLNSPEVAKFSWTARRSRKTRTAISYKVGERVWLRARREAEARLGAGFDLRAWHKFALELGPLGLDDFAAEMARF